MNFHFGKLFLFLLYYVTFFPPLATSQPDFINLHCDQTSGNYTDDSLYLTNLNTLLSSLPSGIDGYGFNSSTFGNTPDTVYAISLCRGDVQDKTCRDCVRNATRKITQSCPNNKEAMGWYELCMLRYSDKSIYGQLDESPIMIGWDLYSLDVKSNASSPNEFDTSVATLLATLRNNASSASDPKKFATGSIMVANAITIYGLMQCTPDLSREECDSCLNDVTNTISYSCSGHVGCGIKSPSCNLRYGTNLFYDTTPPAPLPDTSTEARAAEPKNSGGGSKSSRTKKFIIVLPLSIASIILLCLCVCVFLKKIKRKSKQNTEKSYTVDDIKGVESIQYEFSAISSTTNNFSDDNKLGSGGFGVVYKGIFPTGLKIAVKRLSENSHQGEIEFKNEVMLVAKLQHRNLVKLLGFSYKQTERLLVYEFMINSSLDHFIFDPIKRKILDWEKRYKIISGIARGLLYLHEDSRLRIIHRDLKASNVLLDDNLNPKISDFGMARLFVMDETQGSTNRIVGTYGYMAPEYAMHGHFSVKSDVFSFGVLILEIISGQKNRYFTKGEMGENLLSYTWNSWQQGRALDLIDPSLTSTTNSTCEITRCINIGLLCAHENPIDRPTMTHVVQMLTSISLTLPVPSQPAFYLRNTVDNVMPLLREFDPEVTDRFIDLSGNGASMTELYPR